MVLFMYGMIKKLIKNKKLIQINLYLVYTQAKILQFLYLEVWMVVLYYGHSVNQNIHM